MSNSYRKRKQTRKTLFARAEGAPVLSQETKRRIEELGKHCIPGRVYNLGIFHEQFCADALRAGAKKCACTPDIRLIEGTKNGRAVELPNSN